MATTLGKYGKSSKQFSSHEYDIVIPSLSQAILRVVHNNEILKPPQFNEQNYLSVFQREIENYCEWNNIEFISWLATDVIISSSSNQYHTFLSYSLAYREIHKLKLFLDYQKNHYQGNYYAPKENFIGLVEFHCNRIIRAICFSQQQERLITIMEWVREMRKESPKIPRKLNITNSLEWINKDYSKLKSLSRALKVRDYTKSLLDFKKVFVEKEKCEWLKSPESLAYLLYMLYNTEPKKIKVYPKGKGYFLAAKEYFYDYSGKVVKEFNLKNALHNLLSRYSVKFNKDKQSIDTILKEVFNI